MFLVISLPYQNLVYPKNNIGDAFSLSVAGTSDVESKDEFDLNEGFSVEDGTQIRKTQMMEPLFGCSRVPLQNILFGKKYLTHYFHKKMLIHIIFATSHVLGWPHQCQVILSSAT